MYRFRKTFEMDKMQMSRFLKLYAKKRNRKTMVFFCVVAFCFCMVGIYFATMEENIPQGVFFIILAIICIVLQYILQLLYIEVLTYKPPFAVGAHITIELQDGFFHVNCFGKMKSYSRGDLVKYHSKKQETEDYILFKRRKPLFGHRDVIVIPEEILTDLIRTELDKFLGESK